MKILVIKTSAFGDIVQAYPFLNYLRDRFPHAEIDWVVEERTKELILRHPAISSVLQVNTSKWKKKLAFGEIRSFYRNLRSKEYDVVFDLQGNCKSAFILAGVRSKVKVGYGRDTVPEFPNLFFTNVRFNPPVGKNVRDDYLSFAKNYFKDERPFRDPSILLNIDDGEKAQINALLEPIEGEKKIIVFAGSAWKNKQLKVSTLFHFLKLIQEKWHPTFLLSPGNEAEREQALELNSKLSKSIILDKLPLPSLQHLIARCDYAICMDSLPLHLAATTGTKTFSIFGPSSKLKYAPTGDHHYSIQGPCPYGITFEKRCPILRTCKTGSCMHDLEARELFAQFQNISI